MQISDKNLNVQLLTKQCLCYTIINETMYVTLQILFYVL